MGARRSIERKEFLSNLAVMACYHNHHGFPEVEWSTELDYTQDFTAPFHADITNRYVQDEDHPDYLTAYRVDIDLMARGVNAIINGELVSEENCMRIKVASKANDASDLDVVDALAILEIAIFGRVRYP